MFDLILFWSHVYSIRSNYYRITLQLFVILTLIGNFGSLFSRLYMSRGKTTGSFHVFICNLCLADGLMGLYLLIIGVADYVYSGVYIFHDEDWKASWWCKLAGFLSVLSSEVSAFTICLITHDRYLVVRFPFSKTNFNKQSTYISCALVWWFGVLLASIPLIPATSHWEYYSQTGVCIPLPFSTGDTFKGYMYAFSIMIMLNFVVFVCIACGQISIYLSIKNSEGEGSSKDKTSRDSVIARRLTTVVVSDFLCWFPVGCIGALAAIGMSIDYELNCSTCTPCSGFCIRPSRMTETHAFLSEGPRLDTWHQPFFSITYDLVKFISPVHHHVFWMKHKTEDWSQTPFWCRLVKINFSLS